MLNRRLPGRLISRAILITVVAAELTCAQPIVGSDAPTLPVVSRAQPLADITALFIRSTGWTGADSAYSIPLGKARTLWLFGDTWVGEIHDGKRVHSVMINNSAAWQDTQHPKEQLKFFWRTKADKPISLLVPNRKDCWYWPGDGLFLDEKLYLFCMVVARDRKTPPPFSFKVIGHDLLKIDNPEAEPDHWRISRCSIGGGPVHIHLGVSCLVDGDYVYVYGSNQHAARQLTKHQLVLARIRKTDLDAMDMRGWQYWCKDHLSNDASAGLWTSQPVDPIVLIPDAAPEMTVSRVADIPGLFACYFPAAFKPEIMIRHAMRPEGPWSEPVTVYRCPEANKNVFVYSAKAHPELSTKPGELVITYCRNTAAFEDQLRKPEIYFPQAIVVHLYGAH